MRNTHTDGMEVVESAMVDQGFSHEVARRIAHSHRSSTNATTADGTSSVGGAGNIEGDWNLCVPLSL